MRKHLTNAAFGVLDYVSYPVGMLLVAPIVLHKLGASEYGLWMIATALISAGGIVASGFCDANIQRVAHLRGSGQPDRIPHTMRSMLGINLVLGASRLQSPHGLRSAIRRVPHCSFAPDIIQRVPHLAPHRECIDISAFA